MKPALYLPSAILLAIACLSSCSRESSLEPVGGGSGQAISQFEVPGQALPAYQLPPDGDMAARYLEKLQVGTREGHRFASERLLEMGPAVSARLTAEIRRCLSAGSQLGYLVSLCESIDQVELPQHADVLMDLVDLNETPVVRSAALEALGRTGAAHLTPRLLDYLRLESERSPRAIGLNTLGRLGAQEGIDFLTATVEEWLAQPDRRGGGQDAWNALLLVDNPTVLFSLIQLTPKLAPFQALQAYGMRIRLGDRDVAAEILPYLVAEHYPSTGTRTLALQLLGELGDWASVLSQQDASEEKILETLIALLRRPDAVEQGIGLAVLDSLAEEAPSDDLRMAALKALVERGQQQRLDPYLRQLREYPIGAGSIEAMRLLGRPDFADERVAAILISRWPFADWTYRNDILRSLTRTGSEQGAHFLAQVAIDPEEDREIRQLAVTILSNFGPIAVPLLLEVEASSPDPEAVLWILPGLGRYASEVPQARESLLRFASSAETRDRVRRSALELMPNVFRSEAIELLWQIRQEETRGEVVRFVDSILREYF